MRYFIRTELLRHCEISDAIFSSKQWPEKNFICTAFFLDKRNDRDDVLHTGFCCEEKCIHIVQTSVSFKIKKEAICVPSSRHIASFGIVFRRKYPVVVMIILTSLCSSASLRASSAVLPPPSDRLYCRDSGNLRRL